MTDAPKPGDRFQLGAIEVVVGCKHILAAFPEGVFMPKGWTCGNCVAERVGLPLSGLVLVDEELPEAEP